MVRRYSITLGAKDIIFQSDCDLIKRKFDYGNKSNRVCLRKEREKNDFRLLHHACQLISIEYSNVQWICQVCLNDHFCLICQQRSTLHIWTMHRLENSKWLNDFPSSDAISRGVNEKQMQREEKGHMKHVSILERIVSKKIKWINWTIPVDQIRNDEVFFFCVSFL